MNNVTLALLVMVGFLMYLAFSSGNIDTSRVTNPDCSNPGAQVWTQKNPVDRIATGLCASWQASK